MTAVAALTSTSTSRCCWCWCRRRTACRELRRCSVLFATLFFLPTTLYVMVTNDPYYRSVATPSTAQSRQHHQHRQQRQHEDEAPSQWGPNFTVDMNEIEMRMADRRHYLEDSCHRLGLDVQGNDTLHRPNPWEFLVNRPHRIIWCNIFKSASTSWMYNFNLLAGYRPEFLKKSKSVPLSLARRKYPRLTTDELRQAQNDSVTFLIVRHPFERLLSAYRDKIQYALPNTVHSRLGTEIILKHRPGAKKGKAQNPRFPVFPEFVDYVISCHRNGNEFDMHWTPMTQFCTPCQIHFDIIAKFESLEEDQMYIIKQAGLEGVIKPQWRNSSKRKTTDLLRQYYSQLSRKQIKQLYSIYRYDFEIFNYTLDGYLEQEKTDFRTSR